MFGMPELRDVEALGMERISYQYMRERTGKIVFDGGIYQEAYFYVLH